ncbi:MAG: hypothetical protein P0Y60_08255 [Candidatus Microbacterium colombiense]|nr:MAG: hypothetical protein P0Y60_08255 [Microbacterium sp.]
MDERISDAADVQTVGWADSGAHVSVRRPSSWAAAAQRRIGSGIPARIVLRLLGADNATQFARAISSNRDALRVLATADLVVAAEEDAAFAAWRAARPAQAPRSVYGTAAALAAVDALSRGVA